MKVLLPPMIQRELTDELGRAGTREIGGILMARQLEAGVFRVERISVQRRGGGFAHFVRALAAVARPLRRFFADTGQRFSEYNYLGEWHSHPSFALAPSGCDARSMQEIVDDPDTGAQFAVLLLVKLQADRHFAGSIHVFLPDQPPLPGDLLLETR